MLDVSLFNLRKKSMVTVASIKAFAVTFVLGGPLVSELPIWKLWV